MARSNSFEWHLKYFEGLCKEFPDPKWEIGLEAAQIFAKYHSDKNIAYLHQIIKILMPYRKSGTEFNGFWWNVIGCISNLPVNIQVSLWNEILDPENQGELLIEHNDIARAIIKQWLEMDQNKETITDTETIAKLARENYKYFLKSEEWFFLLFIIDKWYKTIISSYSLWDHIVELARNDK